MSFTDYFSKQSELYSKVRPQYPKELYAFLKENLSAQELAWDCGTGNGQVAVPLADFFTQVMGSDPSDNQLKKAIPRPNISYKNWTAEQTDLANSSVDLITVAAAFHWFDSTAFIDEAIRVLKPGACIAIWSYYAQKITSEIDELVIQFSEDILGPFWSPKLLVNKNKYQDILFPFQEIKTPVFVAQKEMNMLEFLGYLRSWSASQLYADKQQSDPTDQIKEQMETLWGDPQEKRRVSWDIFMRFGRKPYSSFIKI